MVITAGLAEHGALFTDNVTVSLSFTNSGNGLRSKGRYSVGISCQQYDNALLDDASPLSADATAALTRLAVDGAGANNPVTGTGLIFQGRAGRRVFFNRRQQPAGALQPIGSRH